MFLLKSFVLLVAATPKKIVEVQSMPISSDLMSMEFIQTQTYESWTGYQAISQGDQRVPHRMEQQPSISYL